MFVDPEKLIRDLARVDRMDDIEALVGQLTAKARVAQRDNVAGILTERAALIVEHAVLGGTKGFPC